MNLYQHFKSISNYQDQIKFIVNESSKRNMSYPQFIDLIIADKKLIQK